MEEEINICELCGPNQDDHGLHNNTKRHHLNFILKVREKNRSKFVNYHGISIEQNCAWDNVNSIGVSYNDRKAIYTTNIKTYAFTQLDFKLEYNFIIKNQDQQQCNFIIEKLYPLKAYFLSNDLHPKINRLDLTLKQGECFKFKLTFQLPCALNGCYDLPIGITVQPLTNPRAYKTLYRDVKIIIQDEFREDETVQNSPFCKDTWDKGIHVFEAIKKSCYKDEYPIPKPYLGVFLRGFKGFSGETVFEQEFRLETINMWKQKLNEGNYASFFHRLLWLDEVTSGIGLKLYNMSNVNVTMSENAVMLKVPGLAEKRPSVLRGDYVLLRVNNQNIAFKGLVERVEDELLRIEHLQPEFVHLVKNNPNILLDVSFCLSRLQLERMHKAVDNCVRNGMIICLFPKQTSNPCTRISIAKSELFNPHIADNAKQLIAVESIINATSKRAPYIIYGPPGTGKTVTLVEAILQIKKHNPCKRILVCAPSNAACDMLASKLNEQMKGRSNTDLFRIHTGNRNVNDIPEAIKPFSNLNGDEFTSVAAIDLYKYKIVISTLHLIGKYAGRYSPDMVFIDEAAQATEPECVIPISLLTPNVQIVLAGDPKQLGPICNKLSAKQGLAVSLLDRLMQSNELYYPVRKTPLLYNNNYITMLVRNYRSHKHIIQIPNELFYGRALEFGQCTDPISDISIASKVMRVRNRVGAAVEFIGISSKEQRNGNSPSYYNDKEIEMVLNLISRLMKLSACRVAASEIGVIAPYIRQVVKIRNRLTKLSLGDIQVGTTEAFQGGEKRIMIISTVRAQSDLLRYDKKYDLGFVRNKRRFNVAITRAKAKLIIVGNPLVLGYDEINWGKMLNLCQQDLNSYFGVEYVPRTEDLVDRLHTQFTRNRVQ